MAAWDNKQSLAGRTGRETLVSPGSHQASLPPNGKDVMIAGPGDVLTGGNGPDTSVFRSGFGYATITDFDTHVDDLQWDPGIFPTIQSVLTHGASDGHGGTVISCDANNGVTLLGVTPESLHLNDFLIG